MPKKKKRFDVQSKWYSANSTQRILYMMEVKKLHNVSHCPLTLG